jgi:hypothetical protein
MRSVGRFAGLADSARRRPARFFTALPLDEGCVSSPRCVICGEASDSMLDWWLAFMG